MIREGLPALPYSVEEVYGIRTSGKYGALKQSYHSFYRIYPDSTTENIKPEKILTEDSNSGYQFLTRSVQSIKYSVILQMESQMCFPI